MGREVPNTVKLQMNQFGSTDVWTILVPLTKTVNHFQKRTGQSYNHAAGNKKNLNKSQKKPP